MKLRGDDPTAMKDFIFNIQKKVTEFRSLSDDSQEGKRSISRVNSCQCAPFTILIPICTLSYFISPSFADGIHAREDMWYKEQQDEN